MSSAPTKPDAGASNAQGATNASTSAAPANKDIPGLGALDEDDEFEEFQAQDWPDSETSLSHLSKPAAGAGASTDATTSLSMGGNRSGGGDHLWEDNWDDDDVEDDFSKALRAELAKSGTAMAT